MKITFTNLTPYTIWVAYLKYDPDVCGDYGNWRSRGWFKLSPLGSSSFYTNNRYSCFYAEASNGTHWSGNYGPVEVKSIAFDSCIGLGTWISEPVYEIYDVGMRLITADGDKRLNLVL